MQAIKKLIIRLGIASACLCLVLVFIVSQLYASMMAYADPSRPRNMGVYRCTSSNPNSEYTLVAKVRNNQISTKTAVGDVLTTIEMVKGAWEFNCSQDFLYPAFPNSGNWYLGLDTMNLPAWENDPTVCLLPEQQHIGIRFYNAYGNAMACGVSGDAYSNRIIEMANGSVMTASANYNPFAELVRTGDLPLGEYQLPDKLPLFSLGWYITSYGVAQGMFTLHLTNTSMDVR
ncbi:hypothetical protein [Shewanella fidelis]|uniref:hypothetical protein n=1 Tax=Shewanella fidelis TaxID=173509 RepID=UPI00048BD04B|nr:hypothetical protein [Shewanella fidelis]